MLIAAQEFDERDSATDTCDGAPKYRQATRMVEVSTTRTTARSEPLEQRIDGDDVSALWLYRRNDYEAHDYMYGYYYNGHLQEDGYHSYGWTVSNGVDAEHCHGVYHHYYHTSYEYAFDWSTDHVLVGHFRGGTAYDDKFASNVPTELRWDEVVENTGSTRRFDDCFDYRTRCWETTRDEFSVVSSQRCLCLLSLAYIASITELLCMCDYAPVRAMASCPGPSWTRSVAVSLLSLSNGAR